ncbi:MAG: glycosyltransferase family 39 protein [Anaerolineae bacterium]
MLEALKRLLSPEYLAVAEPGPLGGLWVLYVALGALFASGMALAAWVLFGRGRTAQPAGRRAWAWFELWICLFGLGAVLGRFASWPGWSARIWPYSLVALAIAGGLVYRFRRAKLPARLADPLRLLAFSPLPWWGEATEGRGMRGDLRPGHLLGLACHLLGIGLVLVVRYGWPWWTAPLVLLFLLTPQAPLLIHRRRPSLLALTPLFGAYAVTVLWLLYRWLDITVIGWQGLAFPDPMASLFYTDGIVLAAVAYAFLSQGYVTLRELGRPRAFWRWAMAGLLVTTLTWAGVVYFGKRTHGATASDPYAYAQMGVDLAENGTFLHRFSLFREVIPLDIAWAPLQPVGYHIPRNSLGDCPSVWATGASALLAVGYKLLGEVGLYVTTPFVALLALAATWALVQEALRDEPRPVRHLTAALTVALLATSPEHVDRLLVPMADAPAQLFTVLTLFFILRASRKWEIGKLGNWELVVGGVFFAWAYWVRHTQLVLALPILVALWQAKQSRKISNIQYPLAIFFGAALLAALPDILYRWQTFGGPLATETTELPAMGLQHIGPMAWQMLREALVAGEWGYLFPLALYGGYRLARQHRRKTLVLGSAFAAVLLVHLSYRFLRLRDLLSLFPLVDLAVAYGAVSLIRRVRALARRHGRATQLGAALLPAATAAWVVLSLALARWAMIDNVWKPGWASFGYMRVEQRAAFDRLAELTPPEAVVGASLNAGAVMLYTDRDAIRPYDSWTDNEWGLFLEAMRAEGRPIYLMDDGGLMAEFIKKERSRHRLTPVAELQMPLFYAKGRETGKLYRLEWEP